MAYVINTTETKIFDGKFISGIKSFGSTLLLFLMSPLFPLLLVISFLINYITTNKKEKSHKGIVSIFLYTCAIFYKNAYIEAWQFIDNRGEILKNRTKNWPVRSLKIQKFIHVITLCEIVCFTYFVGEDITDYTERGFLYKKYVKSS